MKHETLGIIIATLAILGQLAAFIYLVALK